MVGQPGAVSPSDYGYRFDQIMLSTKRPNNGRPESSRDMEIDPTGTFLAIITYGGFHKAAERLHVSQPAISRRVRALEASLGAELFTRGRARPELSPAGALPCRQGAASACGGAFA
jgi:hypothetical protein